MDLLCSGLNPNDLDELMVWVHETVDDMLNSGCVPECDSLLRSIDLKSTHTDVLLSFLMATYPVPRNEIPFRKDFLRVTKKRLVAEVGSVEAREILSGLR